MQIRKLIVSSFKLKAIRYDSCADPGIFVRWGGGGGGGVQVHLAFKKSSDIFFLYFYFREVQWLLSKKTIICQGSSGVGTFSRGSNFFTGGPIAFSL